MIGGGRRSATAGGAGSLGARLVLAAALQALTLGTGAALLWTSALLLSRAALHPGLAALSLAIVGVRFFGLARGVLRYVERLFSHDTALRASARLRAEFTARLVPLAPARLALARGGDLTSRLVADVEALENAGLRAFVPLLGALMLATGVLVALPSPSLAGAAALGLAVAGLAAPLLGAWRGARPSQILVEARGALQARIVDGLRGLAELTILGALPSFQGAVELEAQALSRAQDRAARAGAAGSALAALATDFAALAALLLGAGLAAQGALAGERLAGVVLLTLGAFEATLGLPSAFAALGAARTAERRLAEVTLATPAVGEPAHPRPAGRGLHLEARDLSFTYPEAVGPTLRGISLVVEPGRVVAVVGASGSGKSTLVRLLARFWDVPGSSLYLDGTDVRHLATEDVRARVAVLGQPFHVLGGSLGENLRLARPDATEDDLREAARFAGLDALLTRLPEGASTWVGEHGTRLSGGERQRIALAQAWLSRARLLVLDEPTTHLDAASEREALDGIVGLGRDRGVLLVTHRFAGLRGADEILVLDRGEVRERGRFDALAGAGGLFARGLRTERRADLDA
ncbi:MAG TPA: thiol reductant ABC exporter subunit CydC [Vicinamibacteria bacterium]